MTTEAKFQERTMRITGVISSIKHSAPLKDGPDKGKIKGLSYINFDFTGGQLNFGIDYMTASKLQSFQSATFEFLMKPRFFNGQNAPYCLFMPSMAKLVLDSQ